MYLEYIRRMSTPTTDAAKLEKRHALEKFNLKFGDRMIKQRDLEKEMNIMPATKEFMVKYERLYMALHDELEALRLEQKVSVNRILVFEKFADQPELVADAMRGFDELLRESREKVRDWGEYFLNREPKDYSVYYKLGSNWF